MPSHFRLLFPAVGFCALLPLLAGCTGGPSFAGPAPKAQVSSDASADFAAYRTYVFLPGQMSADPTVVKGTSDDLDRRVDAALAAKLPGKGLRPATGDQPVDLYITYFVTIRREAEIVHAGSGRSQSGGYDEAGAIAPGTEWGVPSYDQGSMVLQFTDARTRAGVWQAKVTSEVVENNRVLDRALDAALQGYPPKKK